jgi:hypothetical protein
MPLRVIGRHKMEKGRQRDAKLPTIMVNGWSEWQTYRSDRGAPPWIKVHRSLMSNVKWASLTDAEKGQIVSIWIVAADNKGEVPNNPKILKKICQLDSEPNLDLFFSLSMLRHHNDADMTPDCQLSDQPETETETETEAEKRKKCPHLKIINLYNVSLSSLPVVNPKLWGGERKDSLRARWATDEEFQDLHFWENLFIRVSKSDFLMGRVKKDAGYKNWKVDLGWIVKPNNFAKILEGKYDNRQGGESSDETYEANFRGIK